MSNKTFQSFDLESCIGKEVKIYSSTTSGIEKGKGIVKSVHIPDALYIDLGQKGRIKGDLSFPFAGWDRGIIRIEYNDKVVYENFKMPNQYPNLSCMNDEDLVKLNKFRTKCFGSGHEF